MRKSYPIFLTEENNHWRAYIPDFDIEVFGTDITDAISTARDVIGLIGIDYEDEGQQIPQSSTIKEKKTEFKEEYNIDDEKTIVSLLDVDFTEYRRLTDLGNTNYTVTLPKWLTAKAEQSAINISSVFHKALISELFKHPEEQ